LQNHSIGYLLKSIKGRRAKCQTQYRKIISGAKKHLNKNGVLSLLTPWQYTATEIPKLIEETRNFKKSKMLNCPYGNGQADSTNQTIALFAERID